MYQQLLSEHQLLQKSHSSLCQKVLHERQQQQQHPSEQNVSGNNGINIQKDNKKEKMFKSKIHKLHETSTTSGYSREQMIAVSLPFLPQEEEERYFPGRDKSRDKKSQREKMDVNQSMNREDEADDHGDQLYHRESDEQLSSRPSSSLHQNEHLLMSSRSRLPLHRHHLKSHLHPSQVAMHLGSIDSLQSIGLSYNSLSLSREVKKTEQKVKKEEEEQRVNELKQQVRG